MAKYTYLNYKKFNSFIEHLPEEHHDQFKAIVQEGQLLAKTSLQASLDLADTLAQSISTVVVMRRTSWLQMSGFPREVQSTIEDLPIDTSKLFVDLTDAY
ncbi:hypothetical protein UY3_02149 [Chelonia mydas]|uniref:Uncharacterized protein n=1 Tax=Chelonia mydas TaxID=8469 RepID=M7CI37_CHEMY|nr:hypothetical protein UY3_02149 [Chelonia mydas]